LNTLILTEKPSVARDFAKALGANTRKDGFLEGSDWVITWAVGHLVELAAPKDYDPKWAKWNLAALPILPEQLRYQPIHTGSKQLRIVQQQLTRKDIARVIIATDAGREGEVIARTILQTVPAVQASLWRFWTSQALTAQVIRDSLQQLKPASTYDRLWEAGQARQIADWLVGMNFSRAATLTMARDRNVFSVGRVQTAVLALIVDRRRVREDFKAEPYWLLRACFTNAKGAWWGTWFRGEDNRFTNKHEADQAASRITGEAGEITALKREKKKQPPPQLYSLTDLQREANTRYALSAQQTLDTAQKLYEDRKCLSYPRTDSRVLGSQNVTLARELVAKLSGPYAELFAGVQEDRISGANKRVFNDAKLTDHHALVPLAPLPGKVSQNEQRIYELVLKRFAAAFHPDYEFEATEVITTVCAETLRTRGNRPLKPGWKAVYGLQEAQPATSDDEPEVPILPPLEKHDPAQVAEVKLEAKMTQPPPDYTEALLLRDMTNPARYVSEAELQKIFRGDVGLGTQATRAQIIETLLKRRYVERDNKRLLATVKGCRLIDNLRRLPHASAIATPEETARWELELERIAQGTGNASGFMADIRKFVQDGVEEFKMSENQQTTQQPLGNCPACGGQIMEGKKGFGCANWRQENGGCRFVIWKDIAGQTLGPELIPILLSGKPSPVLQFRSREGKEFTAALRLEHNDQEDKWMTRFVFGDPPAGASLDEPNQEAPLSLEALGKCPRCAGDVVEGKKGYGCKNWREQDGGCRFVIWKEIAGKKLALDDVRELLEKGESGPINGFISKKGKEFSARLKLEGEEFKTVFVF
jgi:DNA topoisomerase III